jgi:hypothetical protein
MVDDVLGTDVELAELFENDSPTLCPITQYRLVYIAGEDHEKRFAITGDPAFSEF